MTSPIQIYTQLRDAAPPKPGRAVRAFDGPTGLGVRIFVEGESRLPGVELECSGKEMPKTFQLPTMGGATTKRTTTGSGAELRVLTAVVASDESYSAVFMELAAKLVNDLLAEPSARAALLMFAQRLGAWARFFTIRRGNRLDRQEELGLIGELLCLESLGVEAGLARALESWIGPMGGLHDFVGPGGCVEAKATSSSAPPRIHISSAGQLDESAVPLLYLCGVLVQEVPGGNVSLPGLVNRIHQSLTETAPATVPLFEERLTESGYLASDVGREWMTVVVRELRFFKVGGDFPRIRPGELRPGVDDVQYVVPWSLLGGFQVPPREVGALFDGN